MSSPEKEEEEEEEASFEGRGSRRQKRVAPHRGDCLCIVTAYAEEGDLFTHIKRARESNPRRYFPERQVLDWTAQIALALDHIHAMRVMHRDLKTQNIFLGRGGVVKLGDFGISRVLERTDDFATTVAGTPYYLSPGGVPEPAVHVEVRRLVLRVRGVRDRDARARVRGGFVAVAGVPHRQRDVRLLRDFATVRRAVLRLGRGYASPGQCGTPVRRGRAAVGDHAGPPAAHAARRAGKAAQRGGAAAETAHSEQRVSYEQRGEDGRGERARRRAGSSSREDFKDPEDRGDPEGGDGGASTQSRRGARGGARGGGDGADGPVQGGVPAGVSRRVCRVCDVCHDGRG